ncbi:MAG: DNA primase [Spirochaetae bacterium HGW-Spirochaetae-9]|nr:MAG: DNA primase [Spirochaetae bacterium HGW-Spirochaetae-9]
MGRIPETVIQEVLDKTNYLGMFQEKIRLTKKGGKWWGLCPFHSEKTASFSVDGERGLFYCFGCQKGGSLIDFLMETDKLSFVEAIEELAERAHVPIPVDASYSDKDESEKVQLYTLYEKLAVAFHWLLRSHESGAEALEILRKRGIPEEFIDTFRIGYAPANPNWLHRFLVGKGFSSEFLARTGLFSARNRTYPLFSDRIMFPIADQRGRVIAFGGRLIHGDGPKYINSPDTPIFHKQENLFAFDKAVQAIKECGSALICEGYMDALSFHAAGVKNAVAPLGTAFTTKQASLIRRRAERTSLCFDSDDAGKKAAERACSIATSVGLDTSVVLMSEGKDASEILEKFGADALKKVPEYSINSGDFLIRRSEELFDLGSVEGKSRAAIFFYPYLDALDSEVKRNGFLDIVGRRMGISPQGLMRDYQKAKAIDSGPVVRTGQSLYASRSAGTSGARTSDLFFMTAVVLLPSAFAQVKAAISSDDLDDTRARDLFFALEEASLRDAKETTSILSLTNDDAAKRFVLAVAASGELDQNLEEVVSDGIKSVRLRSLERGRMHVIGEIGRISRDADHSAIRPEESSAENQVSVLELLKRKMQLDVEISRLKGEVDE